MNHCYQVVKDVLELPSGWYSAMGQGHALSVLVRAHHVASERRYLLAANSALALFDRNSSQGLFWIFFFLKFSFFSQGVFFNMFL